jgi:hypothetical protein
MQVFVKGRMMGKVEHAIKNLPANPAKHIYWIVYNQDMVAHTEQCIINIRGLEYFNNHVTVVAKGDNTKNRMNGSVYFDPLLYSHLGNGNV